MDERRSGHPEERLDDGLIHIALAAVFVAGPLVASLTVLVQHRTQADEAGQFTMAAGAFALGIVALVRGRRLEPWALHAILASGTALLTGFIYFGHDHNSTVYSLFYAWLGLYAFYFFSPRVAVAHVALIGAAYGALLVAQPDMDRPLASWIVTVATPLLTGAVVANLLHRLRASIAHAARRAQMLEKSEEQTRRIIDTAHDGFVGMDSRGIVTAWNPAAETLLGWSAEEAIGREVATLVIPEPMRDAHRAGLARYLETGEGPMVGSRVEARALHREGHELPVEVSIAAVPSDGEWTFNAFLSDLSERDRLDEERARRVHEQAARTEAEALARKVQRLQEVTDVALAHLSLDDLLGELLAGICRALEVGTASILLLDPDTRELVARASTDSAPGDPPVRMAIGAGFAGRVAAEGVTIVIDDPGPDVAIDPALRRPEIVSLIGVPLMNGDELLGVMHAGATEERRFSDEDVSLLQLAAQRIALALGNARLFAREHRIAETLQRSLLPHRLPQSPVTAIAARYVPAASEAEVGGDWYDAVELADGRIVAALGDVEGKGLRAATAVGQLRSAFRAYALEGHGAADITDRLNMLLADETDSLQLATLCVLTFDPGAEEIVYTLAGHLPPLLLGPGGAADYLPAPGSPPLGAFPGTRYRENVARCAPGAALIVYSDGLVERRAEPLDQGLERLAAALRGATATDAEGLCTSALDTLLAGEAPGDDIAILAISNVPLGGRLRVELPADPKVVGRVRFLLDRLMAEADTAVGENARYAIKLACTEACANAIEHAHGPASATFEVEAELADGEVVVRVRDHGVWRPEVDGDSGRGIDLMRAFVSTVDVRSGPDGTVVELRQPLGVAVAP